MKKTVFINMEKILVVDDDPEIQEIVVFSLRQNFKGVIDCASNGEEALQKLKSGSYDLCCTDHRMPQKNGRELILEAQKMGIKTPFIMFSGTPPSLKSPNLIGIVEKPHVVEMVDSCLTHARKSA